MTYLSTLFFTPSVQLFPLQLDTVSFNVVLGWPLLSSIRNLAQQGPCNVSVWLVQCVTNPVWLAAEIRCGWKSVWSEPLCECFGNLINFSKFAFYYPFCTASDVYILLPNQLFFCEHPTNGEYPTNILTGGHRDMAKPSTCLWISILRYWNAPNIKKNIF